MTKRANGQGSVYRDGDRWIAAVTVKDLAGRTKPLRRSAHTKREADRLLRTLQRDRESGLRLDRGEPSVRDVLREWLDAVRDEVRPATFASYEIQARLHIAPHIGHLPARALQASDARDVLRAAQERGLSPASVRYVRKCLHMALEYAVREQLVMRNVVEAVRGPQVPKPPIQPYTVEEITQLRTALEGQRLAALVDVVVAVGLRLSEALGLTWSAVDLEARRLRVDWQLQRDDDGFVLTEPKSASGHRVVGLPAFAAQSLRAHRVRQLEERLTIGDAWENELDLVFTTEHGRPLHRRNVLRWWQGLLEREGLPVRGLKELRHTAATLLHAQGATAKDVQETLGHSDVRITLNVYTALYDERKREIADRMDAALGG